MHILLIFFVIFASFQLTSTNFTTIVLDNASYKHKYNLVINNSVEYIFLFKRPNEIIPTRVNVYSPRNNVTRDNPVLVVARQQKEVLSWQIPLLVDTQTGDREFYNTSRTLCPTNVNVLYYKTIDELEHWQSSSEHSTSSETNTLISVSTSSKVNVAVTVHVDIESTFIIKHSQQYNVTISPSQPKYFYYKFDQNQSDNESHTVLLQVNSDDPDVCMFISIQNASCPVYDLEHDIRFEGYWETVNKQGGITLPKNKFPNGFFVLFVSKSEDYDCTGIPSTKQTSRKKNVTFIITSNISYKDYLTAVLVTLGSIAIFYVVFIILLYFCSRGVYKPMTMDYIDHDVSQAVLPSPTTPSTVMGDIMSPDYEDEIEYDTVTEAGSVLFDRSKSTLCLNDLARKDPRILTKKSYLYLWHVMTVAVFYGLPVVQLVITYQRVLRETGNQDLCYYNFLCAHPYGLVSDFNHIFSNIGYILLGLLFLGLTYRRERMHLDSIFDRNFGIPQHYGLFYAMGVALIMEGVLSASYHVCPNHSNFQFDTSFMYVMAVLIMVKLYQNRHPDINATAYSTFGVLAVAICLGMIGILDGRVYFWIAFTVLHILSCLLLTVQIYYLGCWNLDREIFTRISSAIAQDFQSGIFNVVRPIHKGRMILLIIANVCNWALAVMGLKNHERDFATYLLAIFMMNTTLYTLFYIVMKLCHKEKIRLQAAMFILLTFLCWGSSLYFFQHKSISWALTPAESRHYNQHCKTLQFYDFHDIWHFLSASAMFFSFMMLLTLDDDLTHTHRTKIPVF